MKTALFDTWTEKYDAWFATPAGRYVKQYESSLLLELLHPQPGERILDAGCGTGIFTRDILSRGAHLTGIDLSAPMVSRAARKMKGEHFSGFCGDICSLPFKSESFDKVFSMTALEFIPDAGPAIDELVRVTRKGGSIVVTTLNSLSPWAERRKAKAKMGHTLFENIYFRSPDDMDALVPGEKTIRTAIHFLKDTPVEEIPGIEEAGRREQLITGAFLAIQWIKSPS